MGRRRLLKSVPLTVKTSTKKPGKIKQPKVV